ncbi:unnamed protein product [Aureobasidium pullulans]|nr:unnamed protein product [Aureobasidium pullulans]
MVRYLGWDDIAAVVTMVFGVVVWGCFIGEANWALGKHVSAITPDMLHHYSRWQFAHGMLMVWALHGMKIAFAIFLLRLSNGKIFRRTLFVVMFLGMLTDATLALIPVPVISSMQLNLRTKVCLLLAFGMGLATVACGAVKTYHLYYYFEDPDRLYYNSYFVWGALELYVGIIAACLVSLKPLIASFLDKAKSTIVTSAAIAKSLHHGTPRPISPHQQSPNVSDYEMPDLPIVVEQPKVFRVELEAEDLPTPLSSNPIITSPPKSKRKHRPAPLNREAYSRRNTLELPCMGGQQQPMEEQLAASRFSASKTSGIDSPATMTRDSTARSSLSVPNICGLLTSPSPTFLPSPSDGDLDFFSLIRCRDPEVIAAGKVSSSRRTTIISIPEEYAPAFPVSRRATLAHARYQSIDFSCEPVTATSQTVQRVGAGEVRRRPSMAPSAKSTTSAFLCPPIHGEDFRESQMFFHVMSSGQFRSTAETAAKQLEADELPLSPLSLDPTQEMVLREQHGYVGFSPVFDGGDDLASRERVDSSHAALKKDE